jgi:hypothetical protein
MRLIPLAFIAHRHAALAALALIALAPISARAQLPHAARAPIPPAPVLFQWPEPAFDPAIQCHGTYAVADLQRFLPPTRLALSLPGTTRVALDEQHHCIRLDVEDVVSGRQADQIIRGVAVPRDAVLLEISGPLPRAPSDSLRGRMN